MQIQTNGIRMHVEIGGDASLPVLIKGKAPPPLLSPANTAPPKTAIR